MCEQIDILLCHVTQWKRFASVKADLTWKAGTWIGSFVSYKCGSWWQSIATSSGSFWCIVRRFVCLGKKKNWEEKVCVHCDMLWPSRLLEPQKERWKGLAHWAGCGQGWFISLSIQIGLKVFVQTKVSINFCKIRSWVHTKVSINFCRSLARILQIMKEKMQGNLTSNFIPFQHCVCDWQWLKRCHHLKEPFYIFGKEEIQQH